MMNAAQALFTERKHIDMELTHLVVDVVMLFGMIVQIALQAWSGGKGGPRKR